MSTGGFKEKGYTSISKIYKGDLNDYLKKSDNLFGFTLEPIKANESKETKNADQNSSRKADKKS